MWTKVWWLLASNNASAGGIYELPLSADERALERFLCRADALQLLHKLFYLLSIDVISCDSPVEAGYGFNELQKSIRSVSCT